MTERESYLAVVCSASTDDGGVYAAAVDTDRDSGQLTTVAAEPIENPSFLAVHPDQRHVYVTSRGSEHRVWAVRVDHETGELTAVNSRSVSGASPCYVSVDATGRFALVATYRGGTVEVFPIEDDGRLADASDVVHHEGSGADPDRQEAPHPHAVELGPGNRYAYVPDLGTDRIVQYLLDREDGTLDPVDGGGLTAHPGAGPRHVAFHPNGRFGYVTNELDSTLTAFERDLETGALTELETTSTLPADLPEEDASENAPADVHVHPSGTWVYASNRGHDSVASYAVDELTGRLEPTGFVPAGGRTPRDIALDPSGLSLFAANQHGGRVAVFVIDRESGVPESIGRPLEVPKPVCVGFVERQ